MNYSIEDRKYAEPSISTGVYNGGEMPYSTLLAKFEETDMGHDEEYYNDFARLTLTDRRPDPASFESDQARGGVSKVSGRLQTQYNGHRGDADDPAHPEAFLDFAGDEDREVRGANVDPIMSQMADQRNSRMKYVYWQSDMMDTTTGGNRSEHKARQDNQKVYGEYGKRYKVFDRQLESNRIYGKGSVYKHRPAVEGQTRDTQVGERPYHELGQGGERRFKKYGKGQRASSDYDDQIRTVARYNELSSQAGRKRQTKFNRGTDKMDGESYFAESSRAACYKTAGRIMADIVERKRTLLTNPQDAQYGGSEETQARKHQAAEMDLRKILSQARNDADMKDVGKTTVYSHKSPEGNGSRVTDETYQHEVSDMIEKQLIMKTGGQNAADVREMVDLIARDNGHALSELAEQKGKSGKTVVGGPNNKQRYGVSQLDNDARATYCYKVNSGGMTESKLVRAYGENFAGDKAFKSMKPGKTSKNLPRPVGEFEYQGEESYGENLHSDNLKKERLRGRMGNRDNRSGMTRDHPTEGLVALS